jgi:hypothetical protein
MTETKCFNCGAGVTNGLALCEACQMAASIYLEFLPVYFHNLARWRPGRAGSRPVPGSKPPPGMFPSKGDDVSNALDEVGNDLSTWARALEDDRGVVVPAAEGEGSVVRVTCLVFAEHLTSIATLEWCGEFVRALSVHETRLRGLTEKVAPGWYAGACKRDECGHPTHVVPGLTWVTCNGCGATTYARDHLDTILDEASPWVAKPKALAEAAVALLDTEESVPKLYDRIRQWATEKHGNPPRLIGVRTTDDDGDEVGPRRYRFGDVLALLDWDGQTRTDSARAKAS